MIKLYFTESVFKKIKKIDGIKRAMIKNYIERNILGSINPKLNAERLYKRLDGIYRFDLGDFYMYAEITADTMLINAFFEKEEILKFVERTFYEKYKRDE